MKVSGYHISERVIVDSNGISCSSRSRYLGFLLERQPDTIRILYDMDYSIPLLADILQLDWKTLVETTHLHIHPFHLRYVPGKLFSVKRRKEFAYYADAAQYTRYPTEDLLMPPLVLATRAKEVGDRVYGAMKELGMSPTSLTSPVRAYEKAQLRWLLEERGKAAGDDIRLRVIDWIGSGVFGGAWPEAGAG